MKVVINLKNRVLKNHILLFLTIFLVEIISRIVTKMPLFDWAVFRIFLSINIISIILAILLSFLGRIVSNIGIFLVAAAATIYAIAQAGFDNFLGTYMSLGTRNQAGAVKEFTEEYLGSFKVSFYFIAIPLLLLIIYFILIERRVGNAISNEKVTFVDKIYGPNAKVKESKKLKKENRKDLWIARLILVVLAALFSYGFYRSLTIKYMQNELQLRPTVELFAKPDLPNVAVNQFGIITYGLIDIKTTLFPNNNDEFMGYQKQEQVITDFTRYIDDTAWEQLITDTTNYNNKVLNNYFISQEITPKNNYTGMFEGKNLIVILMESVNEIIINKEYFPNFYKLYSEGWAWTNSYSPRNSCSTGNNEMSGMVSLFTINSSCTANNYARNVYPESIFNLFNNKQYTTSSYHDYTDKYYYRKTIHPNMGSGAYYGVNDLGIAYNPSKYTEWPSDVELMEKSMAIYLNDEKFMVWLDTVSPHQPYGYACTLCDLYADYFANTNYSSMVKRYMSKLKVFDDSLGTLIDGLEKAGKLNDTVIVMYADHYPYGLRTKDIDAVLDYDVTKNNEIDRTPFVIYNPSLTPTKYSQYTSYMNILPTIANLFNLDYDPRLYAGNDLLDADYENRVVFANGSWQDANAFYNATVGQIKYLGDVTYTSDEIRAINTKISDEIKMSNLAIKTNYFNYLDKKLKEYKDKLAATNPAVVPENRTTIEEEQPVPTD